MEIREERDEDLQGIRDVNDAAFGSREESALVDRLRDDGFFVASLVAVEYGEIVGHILFSELEVTSTDRKTSIRAATLAPMAVAPTHQRMGIGSELIRQGIEKCTESGMEAVLTVGQEHYITRFGFRPEIAECLKSPFSSQFLTVLPIKRGIFDDFCGIVIYPDAFGAKSE